MATRGRGLLSSSPLCKSFLLSAQLRIASSPISRSTLPLPYFRLKFNNNPRRQYLSVATADQIHKALPSVFPSQSLPILNQPNFLSAWRVLSMEDTGDEFLFLTNGKRYIPAWIIDPPMGTKFSERPRWKKKFTQCFDVCFGWVILGDFYREDRSLHVFLINLATSQRIQLPPYKHNEFEIHNTKVFLTSSPQHNNKAANVVIKEHDGWVSFCSVFGEKWCVGTECSQSIVFFKGVVYGIDPSEVVAYEFGEEICRRPVPLEKEFCGGAKYYRCHGSVLVESDGELLLVSSPPHVYGVFKIDLETRRWVELTSLGDRFLLLGNPNGVSLDCTDFNHIGFKPNCIYTLHNWLSEFSLEDRTCKRISYKLVPGQGEVEFVED